MRYKIKYISRFVKRQLLYTPRDKGIAVIMVMKGVLRGHRTEITAHEEKIRGIICIELNVFRLYTA